MKSVVYVLGIFVATTALAEEPSFFAGFRRAGNVLTKDIKKVARKSNETLCKDSDSKCLARISNKDEKTKPEKKSK